MNLEVYNNSFLKDFLTLYRHIEKDTITISDVENLIKKNTADIKKRRQQAKIETEKVRKKQINITEQLSPCCDSKMYIEPICKNCKEAKEGYKFRHICIECEKEYLIK